MLQKYTAQLQGRESEMRGRNVDDGMQL